MVGQTLAKYGAQEIQKTDTIVNAYIIAGYAMLLLRGFVWIFILKKGQTLFCVSFNECDFYSNPSYFLFHI